MMNRMRRILLIPAVFVGMSEVDAVQRAIESGSSLLKKRLERAHFAGMSPWRFWLTNRTPGTSAGHVVER